MREEFNPGMEWLRNNLEKVPAYEYPLVRLVDSVGFAEDQGGLVPVRPQEGWNRCSLQLGIREHVFVAVVAGGNGLNGSDWSPLERQCSLDRHHTTLLQSTDVLDQIHGAASVVRWGYQTMAGRGAHRTCNFYREVNQPGVRGNLLQALREARCLLSEDAEVDEDSAGVGNALGWLSEVPGIRRTPFATKILAFMAPESCGVYDTKLAEEFGRWLGDERAPVARAMIGNHSRAKQPGIGPVSSPTVQRVYSHWCSFLRCARDQLLREVDERLGRELEAKGYACGEGARAIDVERMIWQLMP